MISQIQVVGCRDLHASAEAIREASVELSQLADEIQPNLKKRGGGARGVEVADRDASPDARRACLSRLC